MKHLASPEFWACYRALPKDVQELADEKFDLPFPDDSFDVVWMQNVGMNIADKRKLYGEIYRVLKPGGRYAFQEMAAGEAATSCQRCLPGETGRAVVVVLRGTRRAPEIVKETDR